MPNSQIMQYKNKHLFFIVTLDVIDANLSFVDILVMIFKKK